MAGNTNKQQSNETPTIFAQDDGATDVVSTRPLDRPKNRMAASGGQGDFVRRYFGDPNFQKDRNMWLHNFYTGGSQDGAQQADVKMQMGVPLIQ